MPKDPNKKEVNKKENKHFFKDFKAELKKVIWPTPKQLAKNTVAVITIVLMTAIIVFCLDFVFNILNEHGIERIKNVVEVRNEQSDTNVQNSENDNNTNNEGTANTDTNTSNTNNTESQKNNTQQ